MAVRFRKLLLLVSIVSLWTVLSLSACAKKPLVVGFIGPMTGTTANIGVEGYRGFTLAVGERNRQGGLLGRTIEVRMLDDKAEPVLCLEAAKNLVAQSVKLIVLHTTSGSAAGALPWLLEQDALVVTRTIVDPTWAGRDDSFLRFTDSIDQISQALVDFAAGRGYDRIVRLGDSGNRVYVETIFAQFEQSDLAFDIAGTQWLNASASRDDAAAWAVSLAPDAVLAVVSGLDAAKLAQAFDRKGYNGPLLLPTWAQDQNLLAYSGRSAKRIFLASSFNPDDQSAPFLAMKAAYTDIYGVAPVMSGIFGYEIATFLFSGIEAAGKTSPRAVKAALLARRYFKGLQRSFELDAMGDVKSNALLITIENGRYVEVP